MPLIPDHSGKRVATRYRLLEPVGEGGFGRVYRAIDERLSAAVAVKIIHPWFAADAEWVDRFSAEARTAASIGHPGVVRVTDTGVDRKLGPYTVAELVEGGSLRDLLDRRGTMPPEEAAEYIAQAADALFAAHARGVIHRDIKPGNLLLDATSRIRVCDFGIARLQTGATNSSASHTLIGTPAYMSPEQSRGKNVGAATDQYALGIVLFELLAGHPAFEGENAVAIAMAHVNDEPPAPPVGTPAHLEAVLVRALAKSPADRFADVAAMADAVRGVRVDPATEATIPLSDADAATRRGGQTRRPKSPRPRWRFRLLVAAALLAAMTVAGGTTRILMAGKDDDRGVDHAASTLTPTPSSSANKSFASEETPDVTPEPATVDVPSIVGLSEAGARARLRRHGLSFDAIRRESVRQAAGRIVSQRPGTGASATEGDVVVATVSDGPPPTEVPELADASTSDAQGEIAKAGLAIGGSRAVASARPTGTVIRTEPAGGKTVPRGTAVTLVVARSKQWRTAATFELTADGSTSSFRITGSKWRVTYSITECEYVCPRMDIEGVGATSAYEQVSLAVGTHTTYGPGTGQYKLTSDSVTSEPYDLSITVEQYS